MWEKASTQFLAEWERIAARVRDELAAAGLPVAAQVMRLQQGAEVTVDEGNDSAGGVLVAWQCHPVLRERAQQAFARTRYDDPGFRHNGAAQQAMLAAMTAILTSAGFTVGPNTNDYAPLTLKVQAAPEPDALPTWAPRVQESASPGGSES